MSVTIKEIAEMAGVHRSTVDKVLHDRPGVSDPVRQHVQTIIDQCNYQINPIGKALQMQGRLLRIAVLLLEVDAQTCLKQGIEDELRQYESFQIQTDYFSTPYTDTRSQVQLLKQCRKDQVDGIILSPSNSDQVAEQMKLCKEDKIPVVTVNSDRKGSDRLCFVGEDGIRAGRIGGRLMGEFLGGTGKVAMFTSDEDSQQAFSFSNRAEGFRQIMADDFPKITLLPVVPIMEDPEVMHRQMRALFEEHRDIDGVFLTSGHVKAAADIIEEHGAKGLRVICYENYPEILELLSRGIVTATINTKTKGQGTGAMEALLDYLIYDKKPADEYLYTDIEILLRESL